MYGIKEETSVKGRIPLYGDDGCDGLTRQLALLNPIQGTGFESWGPSCRLLFVTTRFLQDGAGQQKLSSRSFWSVLVVHPSPHELRATRIKICLFSAIHYIHGWPLNNIAMNGMGPLTSDFFFNKYSTVYVFSLHFFLTTSSFPWLTLRVQYIIIQHTK